ncbi:polysaccharide biosynthesis tyrosine autokinase [Oscillochloris sp. ZM17-4]|nr:polysaccharide biosynthesis tyrosine autokinase [Oscillochloris sp. ZM17-4]
MISLGAIGVGVLTLVVSLVITPIYEVSTSILVTGGGVSGTSRSSYDYLMASQQLTRTYAELLRKRPLLEEVIARLQLPTPPEKLFNRVKVQPVPQSQIIVISIRDANAESAATIINEIVTVLIEQNRELIATGSIPVGQGVLVVEPAAPSATPVSPSPLRNAVLAAVLSAFLITGAAYIKEALEDKVKSVEEAEATTGAAVLGVIGQVAGAGRPEGVASIAAGRSSAAYRLLQTRVEIAAGGDPAQALLLTSSGPLDGTSTTAASLAVALAQSGKRVILVDANPRRPALHALFHLSNSRGLTTALQESASAISYLTSTSVGDLWLVPSGPLPSRLTELLRAPRMAALIAEWKEQSDIVLLDTPALLAASDAALLAQVCDTALLVVRAETTGAESLKTAHDLLAQSKARVLGMVLNRSRSTRKAFTGEFYAASPALKSSPQALKLGEAPGASSTHVG